MVFSNHFLTLCQTHCRRPFISSQIFSRTPLPGVDVDDLLIPMPSYVNN
jgi:hypothetical protein